MGIFDYLKKLRASAAEPFLGMEPQCVRYEWFTMHLPVGWQFTKADNRSFAASGPGGCSADVKFSHPRGFAMSEFDKHRENLMLIMQRSLVSPSSKEIKLMTGVIWFEATEVQEKGQRLKISLFNSRPRNLEDYPPPVLIVTCTSPGASASAAPDADAEAFCEALRSMKWN